MLEMDDHLQALNIKERRVTVEPMKDLEEISLDDDTPSQTTHIGMQADPSVRKELALFLRNNRDVFAWSHEGMPRISPSTMVHRLNVCPFVTPVRQKKRVFAQERDKAIAKEVRKLLEADFIREFCYPKWLANVVMVKKANNKWRMCIDFTDLNKAYLKESYPLPCIDLLVDLTTGHQLLSFMDTFLGYNQIKLDKANQEKTSFVISQGLFCYKVLPFGLKNVKATYQRLVNKMFAQ